jgi:MoxR-like ATPase
MNELQGLSSHLELDDDITSVHLKTRPAFEITQESIRILDITLPRGEEYSQDQAYIPSESSFKHLCLDRTFLTNARHIAFAAKFDVPCTLEGETSTSKTTVIQWVAHLLKRPVYRLNLNGQTDTSELIGRYIPATGYEEIQLDQILHSLDDLQYLESSPQWKGVYQKLKDLKSTLPSLSDLPTLNQFDTLQVSKMLGLPPKSWEFMEGIIPKGLRSGGWVILDEMNLAEPQILERLNSLLEEDHSLVVSEGDGTSFGPSGDVAVHPLFRIFGTMNPAEYAGRSALSPAFRDRWRLWKFVKRPTENDFHDMLQLLVFGEHPIFEYKDVHYQARAVDPLYPHLQDFPEITDYLQRLATFHYQLTLATGQVATSQGGSAQIGRTRRERYVFTRRGLLTLMHLWNALWTDAHTHADFSTTQKVHASRILNTLLEQIYLDRIQHESDHNTIRTTMRSAGLIQS